MTADEAKTYLKTLSFHQDRVGDIDYMNPLFAVKLATAIQTARAHGIMATLVSGFREPSVTKSSYDEAGYSSHAYGLAADIGGIGGAGSSTAQQWAQIAQQAGLSSPYDPSGKEYNHWQIGPRLELPGSSGLLQALEAAKQSGDASRMWAAYDPIRYPNEAPGSYAANRGQGPTNAAAAAQPGADFYHTVVQRESGGKNIQNLQGGDAWGYYQFTTPTWNGIRTQHPELNLPARPTDASYDQQTTAYRFLVQNNVSALEKAGVPITDQNVYLASFLGAGGAIKFYNAMKADPNASAAELFPKEAAANPSVFMEGDHPRSLASVFALQTGKFGAGNTTGYGTGTAPVVGAPATTPSAPPSEAAQAMSALGSALSGLVGGGALSPSPGTMLDSSGDQPAIRMPALGEDFTGPAPNPVPANIAVGAGATPLGSQLGVLGALPPDPALENPAVAPSITAGAPSMTALLGGVGGAQPGNIYDPRRPASIQPGAYFPRIG